MIDKAFGRTLKNLRTKKGLSQEEFAFQVDLHRTYISQLERGLKSPSLRTMEKLSKALSITLPKLLEEVEHELNS
ncbi:MAG: XRE family transcriptional regulator [Negativicutes bacterium]|nr:XRE family transcriptional regulator [Negativicutes bacterium]